MSTNKKITYHYFYKITNLINSKYYYGVHSTSNLDDGYMGSGALIRKVIDKYGTDNLQKEILKFFNTSEEMFNYEKEFITEEVINDPKCYNLVGGGCGYTINHYVSQEVKDKISAKAKNRPSSNKGKKFITKDCINKLVKESEIEKYLSDGWEIGVYYSEESRKKLVSNGFKGKTFTDEQRKKLSEVKKGKPANNKGVPMSKEQKEKLSKANKGKSLSEEARQKISKANTGRKHSEETKRKMSESAMNHETSEETRNKISRANKGRRRTLSKEAIDHRNTSLQERKKKYGPRVCVTNGINNKFIEKAFLQEFLDNNNEFYIGITKKQK